MKNTFLALLLCSGLAGNAGVAASALPMGRSEGPERLLVAAATSSFTGTIPTEARPITGEARIAKMRAEGRLPDTFVRGRCTYNLAGDPAVVYYVKSCR
jgi:hypothetical protein